MAEVATIIGDQQAYAASWVTQANGFIDRVADLANTELSVIDLANYSYSAYNDVDTAEAKMTALTPARPVFPGVAATLPTAPTFTFSNLIPVAVADFLGSTPTLNIPAAPSTALPSAPSAPTLNDVAIPDAPSTSLPAAPTLAAHGELPAPPSISLPYFTAEMPLDDLVAPSSEFSFYEQAYASALLDATKAKLLSDMENGGYGIEPADELQLWERARAREIILAQQTADEAVRFHASRGFRLPPGELSVVIQRGQQDLQDKLSSINRDIALKRADLYVDNRRFTIQQAKELENTLINYHNSVMERALNASKAVLEFAISVFNAQVAKFNARVSAYQTEAQVFETRVRAALAQVEIYRAILDGRRIEVEIDKTKVDVYRAEIDAVDAVVGIYRTRMEAARIQSEIEANRLNVFRAMTEAYAQQVQAKVAEFSMYRSQIDGETAKIEAFRAEVDAYTAQIAGTRAKVDVQVAQSNVETEQARAKLLAYQASIDGFRADLTSQVEVLRSTADVYRADLTAFATAVDALKAAFQLQIEENRANVEYFTKVADVDTEKARLELQALKATADLRLDASKFGSEFYGNVVASTLGSITTLAAQTTAA